MLLWSMIHSKKKRGIDMGLERCMAEWLRVMERFNSAEWKETNEKKVYVDVSDTVASVAAFYGLDFYRDKDGHYLLFEDLRKLPVWDELEEWVKIAIMFNNPRKNKKKKD